MSGENFRVLRGRISGAAGLSGLTAMRGPAGADGKDGKNGADGAPGAAATVIVGTVTTGAPGTAAQVTNSGTESAAVLDFVIPRGAAGQAGSGTGDMLASTYDPAGGARQVAFAADMVTSLSSSSTDAQYPSAKCVFDYVAAQIAGAIGGSY